VILCPKCLRSPRAPGLWRYEVESVDLLGTDIAHQEWRPFRSETAPGNPQVHDTTQVLQVSDPFQFTICDPGTIDRRIRTETGVEVNILVVGPPLRLRVATGHRGVLQALRQAERKCEARRAKAGDDL